MEITDFDVYNPYANQTVTVDYIEVIENAIGKTGLKIEKIKKISRATKSSKGILVITAKDAIKAKMCGYATVLLWVQGIIPEESYMRHSSLLRYRILSVIEKKGLKSADYVFLVSQEMKEHFLTKYGLKLEHYYVMPCFNEELRKKSFEEHDYTKNVFTYVGGLSRWQCFEDTVQIYKEIEDRHPEAQFKILTKQTEEAENILKKYNVKNYVVKYVPKEQVSSELQSVKFGFCIREDNPVNYVATPTKLSSYVANGVMPIYTSALKDFNRIARKSKYAFCYNKDGFVKQIDSIMDKEIDHNSIYNDYISIFSSYYSKEYHIENIYHSLKRVVLEPKQRN